MGAMVDGQRKPLLLERESELAAIGEAISGTAAGSGVGLLVQGPAGIGKSALLAEARRLAAAQGLRVLTARGGVFERDYPFGVARQLLGPVAGDPALRPALLSGAGAAASPLVAADGIAPTTPDAMFGVMYGVYWALMNLAEERPLLVCVDDLQWSDEASVRLLDFVLRRIGEAPVAVVGCLRSGESIGEAGVLGELEAAELLRVLEPPPLTEAGALALARSALGAGAEPAFASACHARTAGNPFFLVQLLRELADEGAPPTAATVGQVGSSSPRGITRVVLARLARLGPDAVALARAVAVLGDDVRLLDAAELARLPRGRAGTAAGALVAAGVFRDGEGLSFEHPLMRDAVEADVPEEVVGERHTRAAEVLAGHGRDPEEIAAHTLQSPAAANPTAVEQLRAAARVAVSRAAPGEAVRLLSRALSEPPPADLHGAVLFELGAAEAAAQRPEAIEHLIAARERAAPGAARAQVALVLARLLTFAGRSTEVYATLADAKAELGPGDSELVLALEGVGLTAWHMYPAGHSLELADLNRFHQLEGSSPAECQVLACTAFALIKAGHPSGTALELVERAAGGGAAHVLAGADPFTALMLILVLQWSGQLARGADLASALMDEARAIGSSVVFTETLATRANALWRAGELDDSEADARQALETEGAIVGAPSVLATEALGRALVDRGEAAEAFQVVDDYGLPSGREDLVISEILLAIRGRAELALGRHEDALRSLTRAGEISEAAGTMNPAVNHSRVLASEALTALGRHEEARERLAPALAVARRSRGPWELGTTVRAAALVEQPASIELLREALAVLEPSELRLEHARVLVELGAALRRAGSRRDARAPLAEGMDIAHRCGALPLVERARTELLAAGARPRRIERTGVDALTPSERRVAGLAADGRSNREIAQQLFVSARTVEAHLRSAYSKLAIGSRQELPHALAAEAQ